MNNEKEYWLVYSYDDEYDVDHFYGMFEDHEKAVEVSDKLMFTSVKKYEMNSEHKV